MNLLRFFLYISGINFLYHYFAGDRLITLGYHSISERGLRETGYLHLSVEKSVFRKHLKILKKCGYSFLSVRDLVLIREGKMSFPHRAAVIYFDDGLKDVFLNAYPILKEMGIPAIIFPVVDFMERKATYPDMEGKSGGRDIFLSWEELKKMGDIFELGTHTLTHRKLGALNEKDVSREFSESKRIIEENTGGRVVASSYPKSNFTKQVQNLVRCEGFLASFGNGRGINTKQELFFLKKIPIGPDDSMIDFKVKISIWYPLIRFLKFI